MALDLAANAIFSVIDLVRGTLFLAIISFVFVIIASFFHAWIAKKFKLSWLKATIITSYLAVFILIMVLYSYAIISGFNSSDLGVVPDFFRMNFLDWIGFVSAVIARNALTSLIFAFLLLPLEFLSVSVFDFLKEKKINQYLNIFAAVFASCLAVALICLYLLPWIVPGLIYLTFYWHL